MGGGKNVSDREPGPDGVELDLYDQRRREMNGVSKSQDTDDKQWTLRAKCVHAAFPARLVYYSSRVILSSILLCSCYHVNLF